jgi:putative transposase
MIHLLILAVHLLATIAKLVRPGGIRAVVAESLLLKHQLLISSRARRRAPNLNSVDRLLLGLGSLFVSPSRIPKLAVILKPRTLFRFHAALKKCKYRWLFSSGGHRRPGPKGPSKELIEAIVEFKRRNPRFPTTQTRKSSITSASWKTEGSSVTTWEPSRFPAVLP